MATLKFEINLDNDAFAGDDLAIGTAYSLRNLADRIEEQDRGYLSGDGSRFRVADSNGNTIGFATFEL